MVAKGDGSVDQQNSHKAATCDAAADMPDKQPRTSRGRATRKKLLDAATLEFGERGFHDASVSSITRRAGTALGSFYTYFDSKDEIFRALVQHMSSEVGRHAASAMTDAQNAMEREEKALLGFLAFTRSHKEIYRIIDEAEFVDPASYRKHYESIAQRIAERLERGSQDGEFRPGLGELEAWAIMGMNVFLGLRYGVWDETEDGNGAGDGAGDGDKTDNSINNVARRANQLLGKGLSIGRSGERDG